MAFRSGADASCSSPTPAAYLPASQRQIRKPSPKPDKSSNSFFGRRLSIFSGKSDSPTPSRPISISSPIPDSFVDYSTGPSPASTSPSSRTSSVAPSSPPLYGRPSRSYSSTSLASHAETRFSSPASGMFASQQPKRVRRKPVPSYIDLSGSVDQLAVDIVGLGRLQVDHSAEQATKEHRRTSSTGTEGMWASGRDSFMCRELESPLQESEEDAEGREEMRDGLWTISSDLTSSATGESQSSSRSRQSSFSSLVSLRASPCLSSAPFRPPRSPRRSHSRNSSSVSYQSIQIPPSPALSSPRQAWRKTSWELPELELPFMPTLFPTEGEEPYAYIAEPTPLATDIRNPFDALSSPPASTSSSSSSTSSHESSSTMPTELSDDETSPKESAPSPPTPSPFRRPSLFRVMSEGKSYFIEAPMTSPRSSIYSFKSAKEEAPNDSAILEIKLLK